MSKLVGREGKALERIESLTLKENNTFSYKNICCYYIDNEIKDILSSYILKIKGELLLIINLRSSMKMVEDYYEELQIRIE